MSKQRSLRIIFASLVLAFSVLSQVWLFPDRTVAASAGTCNYNYSGPLGSNSTTTKQCSELAGKFSQAANDAARAGECYTFETLKRSGSEVTYSVDVRNCGSDEAGTCLDTFSAPAESGEDKVPCARLANSFAHAAQKAASSSLCYRVNEIQPNTGQAFVELEQADCGDADMPGVGGSTPNAGGTTPGADRNCDPTGKDSTKIGCIGPASDIAFGGCDKDTQTDDTQSLKTGCGFVEKYVNPIINVLAGLVGIVVVGMLIFAGIQYSSAGGDPAKVAAAKSKIINAIIALLAFFFLYAGLQWLVPGGFF